jgi:hypothetical protein
VPDDFTCDMTTELTDTELGAIVRALDAGAGLAIRLEAITAVAECRLESRHQGDCASWQASLIDEPGTAWLRWGDGRRIDWLAGCLMPGCVLYRGHPGTCNHSEGDGSGGR